MTSRTHFVSASGGRRPGVPFVLAAALLAASTGAATASDTASCADMVAGSFLTEIRNPDNSIASRGLLSLLRDGNVVVNDSEQGGVPGMFDPFTSGQGAWRCTGRQSFSAVSINFVLPGAQGSVDETARVDYRATAVSRTEFTGRIELRFFGANEDPLKMAKPAAATYIFSGKRISAR